MCLHLCRARGPSGAPHCLHELCGEWVDGERAVGLAALRWPGGSGGTSSSTRFDGAKEPPKELSQLVVAAVVNLHFKVHAARTTQRGIQSDSESESMNWRKQYETKIMLYSIRLQSAPEAYRDLKIWNGSKSKQK